jgi:hypothetical protein
MLQNYLEYKKQINKKDTKWEIEQKNF